MMLNVRNFVVLAFGAGLTLVGILGLTPIEFFSGKGGLLYANPPHHLVHLMTGIILLVCTLQVPEKLRTGSKVVGLIFIAFSTLGFVLIPTGGMLFGIFGVHEPIDHILHALIGIVLTIIGFTGNLRTDKWTG